MKKLLHLLLLSSLFVACGPSSPEEIPKKWVKVEFMNPTNDTIVVKLFSNEGFHLRDTVAPNSFILDSIKEGDYSLESNNLKYNTYKYLPSVKNPKPWQIKDTANYVYVTDSVKKDKMLSMRFYKQSYVGGTYPHKQVTGGHYFFDLSLDSTQRYAIVNMNFLYGGKTNSAVQAFKSGTTNGKYFIFSLFRADMLMVVPDYGFNPQQELPENLTSYYGIKSYLLKTYPISKEVANEDILKYLYQNYVVALDEE